MGLLSFLAFTDIAHGEQDLASEWTIVQVSAFLVLLFILITLITLRRLLVQAENTITVFPL